MSEHTKITDAGSDLLVVEQLNAMELFTGQAMDPLIEQIKALVDRHVPDVSTARGRGDIASLARRVASSKVILDDLGKDLVADWKEKAKKVDIVRKKMRDELDALRDRAREPLTLWEQAEVERLRQVAFERTYSLAWDEAHAEQDLRERERMIAEKEAVFARQEEEERRKAEAERLERERKEREERIAREATERANREAEAAIQREKDRAEKAERDRIAADARAQAEKEAAVRDAERRTREEADRRDRERVAAEKAERERQGRLAANRNHRARIEREAEDSIAELGLTREDAQTIVAAASKGEIKHVLIQY